MRLVGSGIMLVAALTLALFLGEWIFALLGYPVELPVRAAHPANHNEIRESIEFRYRFTTNAMGLRYRELPREKGVSEHRILVLGDSYTEGLGVDANQRFTEHLENAFSGEGARVAFINGGLSGTGPLYYARLLKYVGLSYSPDGILICIFANDVANTDEDPARNTVDPPPRIATGIKGAASSWWPRIYTVVYSIKERWWARRDERTADYVAEVSGRARRDGVPETRIQTWRASLPARVVEAINTGRFGFGVLAYGLLYPDFWSDSLDLDTSRSERKWANMVGSLDAIVSIAAENGTEAAMVFLPVHFQYDATSHEPENLAVRTGTAVRRAWLEGQSAFESRLGRWAERHGVPFLSLTKAFRDAISTGLRLNYELDGHWTSAGHEVAARAIGEWLNDKAIFGLGAPGIQGSVRLGWSTQAGPVSASMAAPSASGISTPRRRVHVGAKSSTDGGSPILP